jgi:hypothetical protein
LSATSPDGTILRRTAAISWPNEAIASTIFFRIGYGSVAEPAPVDLQPFEDRLELGRRPQRKAGRHGQEAHAFAGGRLRRADARRLGHRHHRFELLASRRRDGEPRHDRHDAVELDRAQRHGRNLSHA